MDTVKRLRAWVENIRRRQAPLSEAIPMIQAAVDEIESLQAEINLLKPHPNCDFGCMFICHGEAKRLLMGEDAPDNWDEAYDQLRAGPALPPETPSLKFAFAAGIRWARSHPENEE